MSTFHEKSHAENILQQLWEQRETDRFSDVVLIVGAAVADETKIPAHRCILSAASEYFNKRFTYEKSKEIKINDVDGSTLNSLIEYCYTGSVEIKEDIVQELLRTADMLLLNNVAMACSNFLEERLHQNNCLGFTLLAERYNCQSLLKSAKKYSTQHFLDVCETDEFLDLTIEELVELLASNDPFIPSEGHKFRSLINWIEHNPIERGKYKDELFNLVRLTMLQPDFLAHYIKAICISAASSEFYEKVTNRLAKPKASYEHLMAIAWSYPNNWSIYYFCPLRLKWMKWLNELDYDCYDSGLAIIEQKLYIAGGSDDSGNTFNTVICVNMKTKALTQVKSMIEPRARCSAAILNGFLYVAGGFNGHELSSIERYDPKVNVWNKVASMSTCREYFGLAELNNKLYAIGGSGSAEVYDPHLNVWTSIPYCNTSDAIFNKVVAFNGLLYAQTLLSEKVYCFDTHTKQWTSICSLDKSYLIQNACTTFQDKLVICYNDRVFVHNATKDEWVKDPFLKGLNNIVYAFSYSDQLLTTTFEEN